MPILLTFLLPAFLRIGLFPQMSKIPIDTISQCHKTGLSFWRNWCRCESCVQKIQHLGTVDESLRLWIWVESHNSDAPTFHSINKCKNITNFSLNVKGNILKTAQMEETLNWKFFYCAVDNDGYIEHMRIFGNEIVHTWSRRINVHWRLHWQ